MHILIAPNAFKNSINAKDAAEAIKEGLQQSNLQCTCECFPVADGGDGTAALLIEKLNGTIIQTQVHDPLDRKITSAFGFINKDETAIIELADASGLRLLKSNEYDPLHASTFGTGEMIIEALNKGAKKIIIGIGGSATVDGGTGILKALGARFFDAQQNELAQMPESLTELTSVDLSQIDKRIFETEIIVLCDVQNCLLGENGAANIFGPQKGATPENVKKLEACLTKWKDVTFNETGKDMNIINYGGAAGGVAAALAIYLNVRLVNGIDYFLQLTHFDESLMHTDLLITGEGSIDEQTLQGKGPFGVTCKAKEKNIPVIAFAGKVPMRISATLKQYFDVMLPINNEPSFPITFENTKDNLIRTAIELGNLLSLKFKTQVSS